jgi:peptidoglycan/xylan/chitin deacetylase (PgdA/CDA1 family)
MQRARRWGFEFVNDRQLLDFMDGKKVSEHPLLHISVDDGWRRNLSNVAEFAERNDIPVTYFIATESIESGTFWWDRVPDRKTASYLRSVPNRERMHYLSSLPDSGKLSDADPHRTAMSAAELAGLARMKHAAIGNHTHNHPVFSRCSDDEIDQELNEAHRRLTAIMGTAPDSFAYPCGSLNGHDHQVLARLGYRIAYTTEPRGIRPGEPNRYDIPRFEDNLHGGPAENFCRLIGLWQTIYHALRVRYKALKRLLRVEPPLQNPA